MKRLLLILTVLLSVIRTMGQVTITSDPVVYAPDEEVTWYFDMSEKMQVEGEPFYIWTWAQATLRMSSERQTLGIILLMPVP